jgi:mannose-1-phosphate guanylyltransferase
MFRESRRLETRAAKLDRAIVGKGKMGMKQEMGDHAKNSDRVWSIVLAKGEGERLRPFVQRWLGHPRPKQYCTFVGTRSLFQHTLDRADRLTAAERKMTVIARQHAWEAWPQLGQRPSGMVLLQPVNRGAAAAVFLALTYVKARDAKGTVVIHPSDHFVYPEPRFLDSIQRAVRTTEWFPDRFALLGVSPDRLELDYGWLEPGGQVYHASDYRIQTVQAFLEKPTAAQADAALAAGALWNTSVVAAKVETLWESGWQCFPDFMPRFECLLGAIGTSSEAKTIETIYEHMPAHDFSSELLRLIPAQFVVIEMAGVLWCDWGTPERITHTLRLIGRQPKFQLSCLDPPFVPFAQVQSQNKVPVRF